jgi:CHAT domain-containing protein
LPLLSTASQPAIKKEAITQRRSRYIENPGIAAPLNNLADLYSARGDYAKAEPLYQRALNIWEKVMGPEHPYVAEVLDNLADLYREKGDYAKAEPFYHRALTIIENAFGPEHPVVASILKGLARLYAAKAEIARSVSLLSRANVIDERVLALNLVIGSERQKVDYLKVYAQQTDYTLSFHIQAAPHDPQALDLAFTTLLQRKARGLDAMTDSIAIFRRRATPEDRALLNKLVEASSRLAALTLKDPGRAKLDTYRKQLDDLKDKVDKLEGELSSRSDFYRKQRQQQSKPATRSAVQSALPANSALVEFARFTPEGIPIKQSRPPRYLAYLLPAQGQPKWVDLGEAAIIDRAVEEWRRALRNPNRQVKRLARALDRKLMQPLRSILSRDTHRLLIAPDGQLNLIPFAALVDEQNRYLIERYSISYLTSGRDLLRLQTSEPSRNRPLLVANPEFGGYNAIVRGDGRNFAKSGARRQARSQIDHRRIFFQPLPATEAEALAIKAMLPEASVLRREQATETALKQARGPQILHIATHGFFLDYQKSLPAKADKQSITPLAITGYDTAAFTHFTIQLESTPAFETAKERIKVLKEQGVDAYILKSQLKRKDMFYRVRTGNFSTYVEAQKYGASLREKGLASEFFVARYKPPQENFLEPEPVIAGNSQTPTDTRSDLRLNKFAAQVKNPLLRSGLALAGVNRGENGDDDGILTALEATYLDLLGTELVVLSACDTGVGEVKNGEGVQGLRRALVLAGSESQVISLWQVSDEPTKNLMIEYYKALQQGAGRSEGLRQVQLSMLRGRGKWRHPYYWAAFIQSGEWANLDSHRAPRQIIKHDHVINREDVNNY